MPPLKEMVKTQNLVGFQSIDAKTSIPSATMIEEKIGLNPILRCPLPPFSTTVDSIRQWNMTGKVPVMRVIPLPTQQGIGGNATNITNVTEATAGAGGSSSTVKTSLLPQTVVLSVPSLHPGATYTAVLRLSQSYQLLWVSATLPIEVRLYSNPVTQIADIARVTDAPIACGNIEGIITDVVLDAVPYMWSWENRVGANADNPQTVNLYVTVVNPFATTGTSPTKVTIVYLPLET